MATQAELAAHLDLSQPSVSNLKNKGVIPAGRGRSGYDLDDCRVAYIRHLREASAGRDSARPGSLEAERARLAKEQADEKEMDNAERRKELVSLPDMSGAVIAMIGLVMNRLGQIPAIVARGDNKLRTRVQSALDDALTELSMTTVESAMGEPLSDEDEEG